VSDASEERVFHCTEGGAHKFWRVMIDGSTQTVHFGRIGATGQTLSKSFASPEEARTETDRLITRKVARGYVEITSDQAAQAEPKPVVRRRSRPTPWRQLLLPFETDPNMDEFAPAPAAPGISTAPPALAFDL
jgi:predicted DNA-binding WGR domain protein